MKVTTDFLADATQQQKTVKLKSLKSVMLQ